MPPHTIIGCFSHKLPDFDYTEWLYYVSHTSSTTVGDFDPPSVLIHVKPRFWVSAGEQYLGISGLSSQLSSYYLPKTERPFTIQTEEDVVRANALYLCHPIKLVLEKICKKQVFHCSEVYSPLPNSRLRADIVWYFGSDEHRTAFAVLEIKYPGTLDKEEFKRAGLEQIPTESSQDWAARFTRKLETARRNESGTLLSANAERVTRQAGAYAGNFTTSYVACLDWQSLVLFQFPDASVDGSGETAYDSYVVDKTHAYMRKALLGFLCEAYRQNGGDFK